MSDLQTILINKRRFLKLSLRVASDLIGISHSYLSTLEKGTDPRTGSPVSPTPETLMLISKAYNIEYEELMKLAGYLDKNNKINVKLNERKEATLPDSFSTPEEAIKFLLEQNVIMGFGGFDVDKLSDDEKVDFANELLGQLKLLSYKYKK